MADKDGYKALAGEVHANAAFLHDAGAKWGDAWVMIREAELPDNALGVIGNNSNPSFVPQFNKCAEIAVNALWDGSAALYGAAEALQRVAHNYSAAEAKTLEEIPKGLPHRPDM